MFQHFLILLFFFAPPPTTTLLQKGLLELQQGEWAAARTDLESAASADTKNPYIWSALAEVYVQLHDLPRAASAAAEAEKTGADNPVVNHALALYYARIERFAKAGELEERYAASPRADSAAKGRAAAWYLAAKEEARALPLAKEAARSSNQAAFEMAQSFLRQQQFDDAVEIVTVRLTADPKDPQLQLVLGVARYGQRRFEDAIAIFLQVIQIDPQIDQPYLFLGRMLEQAGPHLEQILHDTEAWARQNPDNAPAQLVLAKALLTRDPADSRVVPLLRRSIELDGRNWESHYQLGVQLASLHDYAGARDELKRASELNPNEAMPHYHLARVYDRLGEAKDAADERAMHKRLIGLATVQ